MPPSEERIYIGRFFFEYDEANKELHIGKGEESAAMVEVVQPEDWIEFVEKARNGEVTDELEPEPEP